MVDGGMDDVLIASQVIQPVELQQLARLNRHAQVAVAVDAIAQVIRTGLGLLGVDAPESMAKSTKEDDS